MKIGFIGAGKAGFTLGKYLISHHTAVTGFYSKTSASAIEAAQFTNTKAYADLSQLVQDSDALFLTVPDSEITHVWEQLKCFPIENKIISHVSGSFSSAVFSDIHSYGAYGYSIHPLFPIHDQYESYKELSKAFFTIEGDKKYIDDLFQLFKSFGNEIAVIQEKDKTRYHAAAAIVSNLYVGLVSLGEEMLMSCGFTQDEAHRALTPLIKGNTDNILSSGTTDALTGPIERNDALTISNHLQILNQKEKDVYKVLSRLVLAIAEEKHKDRDYDEIKGVLTE